MWSAGDQHHRAPRGRPDGPDPRGHAGGHGGVLLHQPGRRGAQGHGGKGPPGGAANGAPLWLPSGGTHPGTGGGGSQGGASPVSALSGRGAHGRLGPVDPAAGGAHPPGQSFRQPAGEVYPDQPGLSGYPSMAPRGTGTGSPVGGGGGPPAPGFSGDLPSSSGTAGGLHPLHATTCPALGGPKALAGRTGHLCCLWQGIGVCAAPLPPVWLVCQRKVHLLPTCGGRGLGACGDGPPSGG